jgi:hypothetical protein
VHGCVSTTAIPSLVGCACCVGKVILQLVTVVVVQALETVEDALRELSPTSKTTGKANVKAIIPKINANETNATLLNIYIYLP